MTAFVDRKYLGRKVLRNKRDYIQESLEPKDLRNAIVQTCALRESEQERLYSFVTREERVQYFIDIMKSKDNGYDTLLKILRGEKPHIYKTLKDEEGRLIFCGEHIHILDRLNNQQKTSRITELQMLKLSEIIGNRWREVAPRLGLKAYQIEDISCMAAPPSRKAVETLIKWSRITPGKEVNICLLYKSLDAAGIDIEDDFIHELFES